MPKLDATGARPTCGIAPAPKDILSIPRRGRAGSRDDPVTVALRTPHRLLEPIERH